MLTQRATIIGAKMFRGDVEGNHYDNTKIRVMMPVPADSHREVGLNVTELKLGTSDKFDALRRMQFPFEADLIFEIQLVSGRPQTVLHDIKPIKQGG